MKKGKNILRTVCVIAILLHAQVVFAWWNSGEVETTLFRNQSDRSIAIGSDGTIHILYRDFSRLFHIYKDRLFWHTERIITGRELSSIDNLSIALDSNDKLHIIFRSGGTVDDTRSEGIYYTTNVSGTWVTETVVSATGDNFSFSLSELALDSNDNPHTNYVLSERIDNYPLIEFQRTVYYANKDNIGWHTEIILNDNVSFDYSIDIDSNDNPHMIYKSQDKETGENQLEYTYKDSTGWHIEIIYEGNVYNPSIVLDSNDNPLIKYTLFPEHHPVFYFVHKDGTGWHSEEFTEPERCKLHSMGLDSSDNLHISYRCFSGFDQTWKNYSQRYILKYAKRVGTQWHIEVVDRAHTFAVPSLPFFVNVFGNHISGDSSIAINLDGKPHIVYSRNCFNYFTLTYLFLSDSEPSDSAGMTSLKHATRFGFVD